MKYEAAIELEQILQGCETRYQGEIFSFTKDDIILPLQLLVNSIAKIAIKSHGMSESDPFGEDFRDFSLILSKIKAYQEDANCPLLQTIINTYNLIGCSYDGKPLSFTAEEIFHIDTVYALYNKKRQFYIEYLNEKFTAWDEAKQEKYLEIISNLTYIHLNDLEKRFHKLSIDNHPNRQAQMEAVKQSFIAQYRKQRLEERKMEKKRKEIFKSLQSNHQQSNLINNSFLSRAKKQKPLTTNTNNNNDLYNGDDVTIASHEVESKENPSIPKGQM